MSKPVTGQNIQVHVMERMMYLVRREIDHVDQTEFFPEEWEKDRDPAQISHLAYRVEEAWREFLNTLNAEYKDALAHGEKYQP